MHVTCRQPPSTGPVLRHAMTSSHQSLTSDVTAGDSPGAPPDDVIESDYEDDDQPLERDIVKRRIDLFEKQVSNGFIPSHLTLISTELSGSECAVKRHS